AEESRNGGADERENRQHHTQPRDNASASGANVGSVCQRRREKAHAQNHQQSRANGEEDSDEMQNCQNGHTQWPLHKHLAEPVFGNAPDDRRADIYTLNNTVSATLKEILAAVSERVQQAKRSADLGELR